MKKMIAKFLFPRRCPVCDEIVKIQGIAQLFTSEEDKICVECISKLKLLTPPWCMKCGKKVSSEEEFCTDCKRKMHMFSRGRALYEYESVAPSIYRFKYQGRREYADYFGEEMARYLGKFVQQVGADGIVPIPIHKSRLRKRGYNQAALLAKAFAEHLEIAVYENYLIRVKNTKPLKLQNPAERQKDLKKAFIIGQNDVKLKTIILIDDIYTTGSTLDEASRVLLENGAEKIYFITLACGAGV